MADVPPHGGRYGGGPADGGWGPATRVQGQGASGRSAGRPAPGTRGSGRPAGSPRPSAGGRVRPAYAGIPASGTSMLPPLPRDIDPRPRERGLPSWGALVVLLVIAGIGALIDSLSGAQVRGGFNIGIIVASIVAILLVRRSGMFPIVIAPPIVYSLASAAMLYLRSNGLSDHKALYDAASNWLVYGFPAIAGSTAAVLIIAGFRMVTRR